MNISTENNLRYILSILPDGWQDKARELGALTRRKKIKSAEALFQILMTHLIDGCSLRETSSKMKQAQVADISDVAILDRLRKSGEWFQWMNQELMKQWTSGGNFTIPNSKYNIQAVDATRVREPGPTGASWCLHYSVHLPSLRCTNYLLSAKGKVGESFARFAPEKNDLFVGDRAYANYNGIRHIKDLGGEVLVRFAWNHLSYIDHDEEKFDLIDNLRTMSAGTPKEWKVKVLGKTGEPIEGRICAIKKSDISFKKALKKLRQTSIKHKSTTRPQTKETAEYIMIFTTADDLTCSEVLEVYRFRWQIELVFKRMKSLLDLGHLKKTRFDSASSWIHGKILVAILIEILTKYGEDFSPWGYPIERKEEKSIILERNELLT